MKNKYKLLTISILITLSTIAIHVINKIISASALLKNLLKEDTGNYYEWRFGQIYYTRQGNGRPLLLIHDVTPHSNGQEWSKIITALSKNHTVYTLDLLGCGRSDKPKITYTNFLYVQLITDFVNKVIGEKTDVIASGLSGSFTIMTCSNDKEIFNKIMLINPEDLAILNQTPTKQSKIAKYLLEVPLIGTLIYNIITMKPNIELLFTENYLYNPFRMDHSFVDTYYESAHTKKGNGKYLLSSIMGKYIYCNIAHGLKNIDHSIFMVCGKGKEGIEEIIALYTSLNKAIEYEVISNTKQLPQLETPEHLLEMIHIFF
jgi:pimeloyl-ACP methyl ester carboxylesterase